VGEVSADLRDGRDVANASAPCRAGLVADLRAGLAGADARRACGAAVARGRDERAAHAAIVDNAVAVVVAPVAAHVVGRRDLANARLVPGPECVARLHTGAA